MPNPTKSFDISAVLSYIVRYENKKPQIAHNKFHESIVHTTLRLSRLFWFIAKKVREYLEGNNATK